MSKNDKDELAKKLTASGFAYGSDEANLKIINKIFKSAPALRAMLNTIGVETDSNDINELKTIVLNKLNERLGK